MSRYSLEELIAYREKQVKGLEIYKALERLTNNPDFKECIIDGFCTKESARYAHQSANAQIPKEAREDAIAMAQSGGKLLEWLSIQDAFKKDVEQSIKNLDEEIEAISSGSDAEEDFE